MGPGDPGIAERDQIHIRTPLRNQGAAHAPDAQQDILRPSLAPVLQWNNAHVYMHHVQAARSSKTRRMERRLPGFCLFGPTLCAVGIMR